MKKTISSIVVGVSLFFHGHHGIVFALDVVTSTTTQTTSSTTVITSAHPTLTLVAQNAQVTRGGSTALSWSASNVRACAASGGWSGQKASAGVELVVPAYTGGTSVTTRYMLTCVGQGEYVSKTVSVTTSEFPVTGVPIGNDPIANPKPYVPTTPPAQTTTGARDTSTINTNSNDVPPTPPAIVDLTFTRTLARGMSGSDVYALQVYLADDKTLFNAVPNAYYGPVTETAVKRFQVRYGVITGNDTFGYGVFGKRTQAKFLEVYNKGFQY